MPYRLGMDEKTVSVHRGHGVERMGASSLADFVRLAEKLGIHTPAS
jgi:FixJ family two-component response regulator